MRAAAARDLGRHRGGVRLEVVEVRADGAGRARVGERVAAGAAGAHEDRLARGGIAFGDGRVHGRARRPPTGLAGLGSAAVGGLALRGVDLAGSRLGLPRWPGSAPSRPARRPGSGSPTPGSAPTSTALLASSIVVAARGQPDRRPRPARPRACSAHPVLWTPFLPPGTDDLGDVPDVTIHPALDGRQRARAYTARHGQPRPRAARHPAERPAAGRAPLRRARRGDRHAARTRCSSACRALREQGVIRQMSAIFDTRRLGYQSSMLVAARTSARGRSEAAAAVFSRPPGRDAQLPARPRLQPLVHDRRAAELAASASSATVDLLGDLADVESIRPMPALRFFKIGVDLDMKGDRDPAAKKARRRARDAGARPPRRSRRATSRPIRALQPTCRPSQRAVRRGRRGVRLHGRRAARAGPRVPARPGRCAASPPCSPTARPASSRTAWACGRCPRSACEEMGAHGRLPRRLALLPAARPTRTGPTTSSR